MGLDQYLYVRKSVDSKHYKRVDGQNVWVDNPAFDAVVLACDAYNYLDNDNGYKWATVTVPVFYWRKAYHIHDWFVRNVQDGDDDCKSYELSSATLGELRDALVEIMAEPIEKRRAKQEELLPFDGWFDTDDWWESTTEVNEQTISRLNELLAISDDDEFDRGFTYTSSW